MSDHTLTVRVKTEDTERFRLFVFALSELWIRMRAARDPFAADLERIVDRLTDNPDDEADPDDPLPRP